MAQEGRDDKGRFIEGNKLGITTDVARERQLAAAAARKENRIVATALRDALLSEDPETGDPTIVTIVKTVTGRLTKDGRAADLHILAGTLGELEQKIQVEGDLEITCKFGDE